MVWRGHLIFVFIFETHLAQSANARVYLNFNKKP